MQPTRIGLSFSKLPLTLQPPIANNELIIRAAASICFALTLLCPVFCLAKTDSECSAHAPLDGENSEAMSIGAVIEKPGVGVPSPHNCLLCMEGLASAPTAKLDPARRLRLAARHRALSKPPPTAARRHALLQTFLF
jgi:hypothetical protein